MLIIADIDFCCLSIGFRVKQTFLSIIIEADADLTDVMLSLLGIIA